MIESRLTDFQIPKTLNTMNPNGHAVPVAPPPVSLAGLREHFRKVYGLNDSQVDLMLESSSKSLHQALANAHDILSGPPADKHGMAAVFHSLKGLLLNMGEEEWASFTKEVEDRLAGEEVRGLAKKVVEELEIGLAEVIAYGSEDKIRKES